MSKQEKLPAKIKRTRGLVQITRMHITVQAYSSHLFEALKWKLAVRGTKEFRQLYPICLTDKDLAARDRKVPGYIDAIYLLDWTAIGRYKKESIEETTRPPGKPRRESRQLRSWQR